MEDNHLLYISKKLITDAVLSELKKNYQGSFTFQEVKIEGVDGIGFIIPPEKKETYDDMFIDLQFLCINPSLPIENLCSKISNYTPHNESQEKLLEDSKALIDFDDPSVAAGIFAHGPAGIGKTHMAVAVAKEMMKKGRETIYLNSSNMSYDLILNDTYYNANQAWIIDDLNSPISTAKDVFKKVVLNAHNKGGIVYTTSNTTFKDIMDGAFVTDPEEKQRFEDRIKGMFKVLEVNGESSRQEKSWHTKADINVSRSTLETALKNAIGNEDYKEADHIKTLLDSLQK